MILPGLAIFAILVAVLAERRGAPHWAHGAGAAVFGLLASWLWSGFGDKLFTDSEEGLVTGFFLGALIAMLGELLILFGKGEIALHLIPLAALGYIAGLDLLRPGDYAYLPMAILAGLVLLVAGRAYRVLSRGRQAPLALGLHTLAFAVMLFAALYKLIDRGWPLPWAYGMAAGALLYTASHLWLGWTELHSETRMPHWQLSLAYLGGQALMVAAAYYHYQIFL